MALAIEPEIFARGQPTEEGLTGLAGLDQVEVEQADADFRFTDQNTSGSSSIFDTWETARRAGAMARVMLTRAAARGWGEYRTHTTFMGDISNTYSFNNHALRRFHETIKDAVDPNGILSPGKCGIWPKRMRKADG
jgi:hypothetical protein